MAVIDTSISPRSQRNPDLRRGDLIMAFETMVFFGGLGLIESFGFLVTTHHGLVTAIVIVASAGLFLIGLYGRIRLIIHRPHR